jgi:hypothetical protein
MSLILTLMRRMFYLAAEVRKGRWPTAEAVGSKRLRGKQLGIIGLGRIGKAVAVRAKVTRMHREEERELLLPLSLYMETCTSVDRRKSYKRGCRCSVSTSLSSIRM